MVLRVPLGSLSAGHKCQARPAPPLSDSQFPANVGGPGYVTIIFGGELFPLVPDVALYLLLGQ